MGSIPGRGGSRMLQSNYAVHHDYWSLHPYSPCSTTGEATVKQSGPRSPQAQQQRLSPAKNKQIKKCLTFAPEHMDWQA